MARNKGKRKRVRSTSSLPSRPPRPSHTSKEDRVRLSFEHVQHGGRYCLSQCEKKEVSLAVQKLQRLSRFTWQDLLKSGGRKGKKVGFGYDTYPDHALKVSRPSELSEDLKFVGIRFSDGFRVYGVRLEDVFSIVWFDKNHDICPG